MKKVAGKHQTNSRDNNAGSFDLGACARDIWPKVKIPNATNATRDKFVPFVSEYFAERALEDTAFNVDDHDALKAFRTSAHDLRVKLRALQASPNATSIEWDLRWIMLPSLRRTHHDRMHPEGWPSTRDSERDMAYCILPQTDEFTNPAAHLSETVDRWLASIDIFSRANPDEIKIDLPDRWPATNSLGAS